MPKILAFSGSARKGSYNQQLVAIAAAGAQKAGAEVTVINLKDYPLPLFDQDLERQDGLPDNARKLKKLMLDHDGLMIASPEYNSSITPLLKNTIDWCSRAESEDEPPLAAYKGKAAVIMSASPGGLGGLRGLVHLRAILGNIGIIVLPSQRAVSGAAQAFDDQAQLKDAKQQQAIEGLGEQLADVLTRLRN